LLNDSKSGFIISAIPARAIVHINAKLPGPIHVIPDERKVTPFGVDIEDFIKKGGKVLKSRPVPHNPNKE
jgi:hypothetical protein